MVSTQTSLSQIDFQIKIIAVVVGLLQALAWIIMSIICIAFYIKETEIRSPTSYMGQVNYNLYSVLLGRQFLPFPNQSLRPAVFFAFMWVYLILNTIWLTFSLLNINNKNPNNIKHWSEITLLICGWDFITVVILGVDYGNCLQVNYDFIDHTFIEQSCANGLLPALVIAAKGFVLWCVNVVLALKLLQIATELQRGQVNQGFIMSPQPYTPYLHPQGPSGTPYSQQQQMAPNFNTPGTPYQPQHQQVSPRFNAPETRYQPHHQQVSPNINTPGSPYQQHQPASPNFPPPGTAYHSYQPQTSLPRNY